MAISNFHSRVQQYVSPKAVHSAIVSSTGREGSGKSTFAISAIPTGAGMYVPMDRRPAGRVIEDLLVSRRVFVPKTNLRRLGEKKFDQGQAGKMWDELHGVTFDALMEPSIRVVVWDTGNHAWEILRMARFGKLTQVMPHHYGPVNTEFESLLWLAEEQKKIIILVHKMSKEYKTNKEGKDTWTGAYERSGYSHMQYVANIQLEHFRTPDKQFAVRVIQNKINPEVDGSELAGDDCSFGYLAAATWPDGFDDAEWS